MNASNLDRAHHLSALRFLGLVCGAALGVAGASAAHADIVGIDVTDWCYNQNDSGTPADVPAPGTIHLTNLGTCQARSLFYNVPQDIRRFTVSFTYRALNAGFFGCEHGATFAIHDAPQGCEAVGGTGGSLGYSPISPSVAVSFQLSNRSGFFVNGGGGSANPTGPINFRSGHPIAVTLRYDGVNILTETLVDTVTSETFTQSLIVGNLAERIGSETAYVGFTGSTTCGQCSGNASNQYFSDFRYFVDSACPPDLNQDGVLSSQDFFVFVARFFAGTPDADYNRDGEVNSQDLFDFLGAFFSGCI